jgi:type I restriction enzyme, S subunit
MIGKNSSAQPALRFPEFSGDWIKADIDWFLEKSSKPVSVKSGQTYQEIGVRSHGKGIFHKTADIGETLGDKRVFWVVPNSLVLNIVFAWEQAVALTTDREAGFIASHRFPMFIPRENRADTRFARDFFLRPRGKWLLELASPGGAGRNKTLGQSNFAELPVVWPSQPEQKEIADFVGAVDGRIKMLQRRRDALARYKTGMMQRLFDQSLRFTRDDGSGFPDWESRDIGSIYDWIGTNSLSREMLTDEPGTMQNIHYGDIHGKFASRFRQSVAAAPFVKPHALPANLRGDAYCQPGDVVIADASEDHADIGKAIEIIEVAPKSLIAGLHTYIARPKSGEIALGFSGYLFQSFGLRRQIMRIAQGISVLGISKPNLSKLKLSLPHLDEQRKIADCLGALDNKIAVVTAQVKHMQAFKKGLLQQMFV